MTPYEEYTVGDYAVKITKQDTKAGSGELDGFGVTVEHTPSGRTWTAGAFDMIEDVYQRILNTIHDHCTGLI